MNASSSSSSSREVLGITLRSGGTLDQKKECVEEEEENIEELEGEEPKKLEETPSIPYPQDLKSPRKPSKKDLDNPLHETNIFLPLVEALKYIPAYQKFVKDIVTPKRTKMIKLSETVSSVILDQFPTKKRDQEPLLLHVRWQVRYSSRHCLIPEHV